jgi:hypothetical protein
MQDNMDKGQVKKAITEIQNAEEFLLDQAKGLRELRDRFIVLLHDMESFSIEVEEDSKRVGYYDSSGYKYYKNYPTQEELVAVLNSIENSNDNESDSDSDSDDDDDESVEEDEEEEEEESSLPPPPPLEVNIQQRLSDNESFLKTCTSFTIPFVTKLIGISDNENAYKLVEEELERDNEKWEEVKLGEWRYREDEEDEETDEETEIELRIDGLSLLENQDLTLMEKICLIFRLEPGGIYTIEDVCEKLYRNYRQRSWKEQKRLKHVTSARLSDGLRPGHRGPSNWKRLERGFYGLDPRLEP